MGYQRYRIASNSGYDLSMVHWNMGDHVFPLRKGFTYPIFLFMRLGI